MIMPGETRPPPLINSNHVLLYTSCTTNPRVFASSMLRYKTSDCTTCSSRATRLPLQTTTASLLRPYRRRAWQHSYITHKLGPPAKGRGTQQLENQPHGRPPAGRPVTRQLCTCYVHAKRSSRHGCSSCLHSQRHAGRMRCGDGAASIACQARHAMPGESGA
jgi:hypothetical protein